MADLLDFLGWSQNGIKSKVARVRRYKVKVIGERVVENFYD